MSFCSKVRGLTGSVDFERVVTEKPIRILFQCCQLLSIQAQTRHTDRPWRQSLSSARCLSICCTLNLPEDRVPHGQVVGERVVEAR
jgi:hypothetical protein